MANVNVCKEKKTFQLYQDKKKIIFLQSYNLDTHVRILAHTRMRYESRLGHQNESDGLNYEMMFQ